MSKLYFEDTLRKGVGLVVRSTSAFSPPSQRYELVSPTGAHQSSRFLSASKVFMEIERMLSLTLRKTSEFKLIESLKFIKILLPVAYELPFHARCSIYLEKCMRKLGERQVLIWSNCSLLALVRLLYFYFFLKVFSESIIYARSFIYLEHCRKKSGEG